MGSPALSLLPGAPIPAGRWVRSRQGVLWKTWELRGQQVPALPNLASKPVEGKWKGGNYPKWLVEQGAPRQREAGRASVHRRGPVPLCRPRPPSSLPSPVSPSAPESRQGGVVRVAWAGGGVRRGGAVPCARIRPSLTSQLRFGLQHQERARGQDKWGQGDGA